MRVSPSSSLAGQGTEIKLLTVSQLSISYRQLGVTDAIHSACVRIRRENECDVLRPVSVTSWRALVHRVNVLLLHHPGSLFVVPQLFRVLSTRLGTP